MKKADAIYKCRCCGNIIRLKSGFTVPDNITPTFSEVIGSFQIGHRCPKLDNIINIKDNNSNYQSNTCIYLDLIGYSETPVVDKINIPEGAFVGSFTNPDVKLDKYKNANYGMLGYYNKKIGGN